MLEPRRFLSVNNNVLISTYDGDGVSRYNDITHVPLPGGAVDGGIETGLAVAPDGTYYVSGSAAGVGPDAGNPAVV